MAIIYTAHATATGGRGGHTESDDKKVSFDLTPPTGAGTNPEQLFAAGYAACFGGALMHVAKQQGMDVGKPPVTCSVDLHKSEDNQFSLSASMDAKLDMDAAKAKKLMEDTHAFCPYSKATRNNIQVQLKVNGKAI